MSAETENAEAMQFFENLIHNLPTLSREDREYWDKNQRELREFLRGLKKTADHPVQYEYHQFISRARRGGTKGR